MPLSVRNRINYAVGHEGRLAAREWVHIGRDCSQPCGWTERETNRLLRERNLSEHAINLSPVNLLRRGEAGIRKGQRGNVESGVASIVESLWSGGRWHSQGGRFRMDNKRRESRGGRI